MTTDSIDNLGLELEHLFEAFFQSYSRDLRGTEIEVLSVKTSVHTWFFAGANEMRRMLLRRLIEQNQNYMEELDPLKRI